MCNCTTWVPGRYVPSLNWMADEDADEWQEGYEESDTTDIDTHRYRCNICGEIGYYSGAAKNYYEGKTDQPFPY